MENVYDYRYERNGIKRVHFCIVNGISNRYLWHTPLELMFTLGGNIKYFAGGQWYLMETDDILFFNEDCGHSTTINTLDTYAASIQLHPSVLKEMGIYFSRERDCVFVSKEAFCDKQQLKEFQQLLCWIIRDFQKGDPASLKAAESKAVVLFYDILRLSGMLLEETQNLEKSERSNARIEMVKQYISSHYRQNITLQELADIAGYNKNYLCKVFQQQTGFSLMDYVDRTRLQAAADMIEKNDEKLTEIALHSGFSTYGRFSSYMVSCCGKKPQEYKADILRSKNSSSYRHYVDTSNPYVRTCLYAYQSCSSATELISQQDKIASEIIQHSQAILQLLNKPT